MILVYDDDSELPIVVVANDINDIEALLKKNLVLYNKLGRTVVRFFIKDSLHTMHMSQEKYDEELMYADIVQE